MKIDTKRDYTFALEPGVTKIRFESQLFNIIILLSFFQGNTDGVII